MKVAIVGCGNVSALHFDAAFRSPAAQLAAAVDIKPERANRYAEKYGIKAYTDYYEMLDSEKPDVVHICTPHYLHTKYAVEALSRGINVLSEKPFVAIAVYISFISSILCTLVNPILVTYSLNLSRVYCTKLLVFSEMDTKRSDI